MSETQALGAAYYIQHVTILSVLSGLASVAVMLRVWARGIQKMSLELNDYFIIVGLLCALGESAVNIYGSCFGISKNMSQDDIMKAIVFSQKAQFMSIIIWVASVTFIRASIIFLYIRIFPIHIFRMICYLIIVANLCFFTSTILADCLICQPISYRWDRVVGGTGSCGNEKSLDLFIGIFNLILDVIAVVLPMPILWRLKLDMAKKVKLSGMFGMGIAYGLPIISRICALTLYRIYDTTTISASNEQSTYAVIALLTSLETLFGVINACLPVLKPIFNKMRGSAPKSGPSRGVEKNSKSGTQAVFMRVNQFFTLASRKQKDFLSDGERPAESSGSYEEEEKKRKRNKSGKSDAEGGKGAGLTTKEISSPMTDKAERVMGIKAYEIQVRKDVDVESVVSQDERGLVFEVVEGRQEKG